MKASALIGLLAGFCTLGVGAYLLVRAPTVEVIQPSLGPIVQTVVASGQIMPPAEIKIGALVSSTALEVPVREGEVVKAGQVLLQLDDAEAQAAVQQASARLASARAGRAELSQLSAPAAEAQLREAEANLTQAKQRATREQALFDSGVTTQAALEDVRTALTVAQSQKEAAMLQFQAASSGGTKSVSLAATIAQAEAELARAREVARRHTIRAPTDGILLARTVEPGDAVLTGASLFVLSATGATRLSIEPDERNLALLEVGQEAEAATEAFPKRHFPATVKYIAPAVDPERGTVEVRLLVPSPPDFLRPHMTVSVEIEVAQKERALVVPRSVLLDEAKSPYVLTVDAGKIVRRSVKLGILGTDTAAVEEGLTKEAMIVRAPDGQLSPGDSARPQEAIHD